MISIDEQMAERRTWEEVGHETGKTKARREPLSKYKVKNLAERRLLFTRRGIVTGIGLLRRALHVVRWRRHGDMDE